MVVVTMGKNGWADRTGLEFLNLEIVYKSLWLFLGRPSIELGIAVRFYDLAPSRVHRWVVLSRFLLHVQN